MHQFYIICSHTLEYGKNPHIQTFSLNGQPCMYKCENDTIKFLPAFTQFNI